MSEFGRKPFRGLRRGDRTSVLNSAESTRVRSSDPRLLAGKVPSKYTSYEEFKTELNAFEFTFAEPSVLARLAYIEQLMVKQQQAGVFKEL